MENNLKYKRVLLKLSGEALAGGQGFGFDPDVVRHIAQEIQGLHDLGVQVCVVIGGGNIIRGETFSEAGGIDRTTADQMGMMGTIINALAIQSAVEIQGVPTRVQSAIQVNEVCEPFIKRRALRHLEKGRVVVFAGGTGNPYFTTDTAAVLRALELEVDALIKATKVDGIYDRDPKKHADAVRYDNLSYDEAISKRLEVMDQTAFTMCRENELRVIVLDLYATGALSQAVRGEKVGTLVANKRQDRISPMQDILKDAEHRMQEAVNAAKRDFQKFRTGRANPQILDQIMVDYYGVDTPINQVGTVSVPEPRQLLITPYDKNMTVPIEKAIQKSDLGVNPVVDSQGIRIVFPQMTEERRKELVKMVHARTEEGRVAVRNVRRDALHSGQDREKNKEVSEDELKTFEKHVQELTDKYVAAMDEAQKQKDAEVMEI